MDQTAHAPDLSIVIPAYDEVDSIRSVILDHHAVARVLGVPFEIVALDDGSTDGTAAVLASLAAEELGLRVIRHPRNAGIGRSLLDLYRAAHGSWIFFNAADGQIPATELPVLWAAREGRALVIGWRRHRHDPPHRLLMSRSYAAAIRLAFGGNIHDVDSVRLYRADALRAAWPRTTSSFAEAEILLNMIERGDRITEVEIRHVARRFGHAHGGRLGTVVRALWDFARFLVARRVGRW